MILGLHHATALAGDAQRNLDYYTQVLGLRLIKRTVNFDDPATHHFYYSSGSGEPGTLVTFFPWGTHRQPRKGAGQAVAVAFGAAPGMLEKWRARAVASSMRFGEEILTLKDPDGIDLEVAAGEADRLHSVTLYENGLGPVSALLALLGFERGGEEGNRVRFELPGGSARIDVVCQHDAEHGKMGAGIVHHVALRVADESTQRMWREQLMAAGIRVTPVKDRYYFHSIYFRQPGGTLFEIATDGPGFLIDEAEDALGSALCLPPWLEPVRGSIEARLAAVRAPVPITSS
jgi:glyoxalase family protein